MNLTKSRLVMMLVLAGSFAPAAIAQNGDVDWSDVEAARARVEESIKQAEAEGRKPVQPAEGAQPGDANAEDEMMKLWMEAATPGEHHQHLAQMVGEWEGVTKWWMEPNGPANESQTRCSSRMVMDGRFLVSEHSGEMMGMAFQGMGAWGYNNTTKRYESSWYDNMGTMMMFMTGTCSDDGKVFKMEAKFMDFTTGQETYMKETCTITSPDSYKFEMHGPGPDGKEFKMMEITYKRVKAGAVPARPAGSPTGR